LRNILRLTATIVLVLSTTLAWGAVLPLKSSFVLAVGEKAAMWLVRGDCSDPAPSYSAATRGLKKSSLGKYSDGGTGTRDSDRCGRAVNVRIISFTGTKAGKERLTVEGQRITIEVK
jgi:hypothetical protein